MANDRNAGKNDTVPRAVQFLTVEVANLTFPSKLDVGMAFSITQTVIANIVGAR